MSSSNACGHFVAEFIGQFLTSDQQREAAIRKMLAGQCPFDNVLNYTIPMWKRKREEILELLESYVN